MGIRLCERLGVYAYTLQFLGRLDKSDSLIKQHCIFLGFVLSLLQEALMSKFFDFCNKYQRRLGAVLFLLMTVLYVFPVVSYWDYFNKTYIDVPYFLHYMLELGKMSNFVADAAALPGHLPLNRQLFTMDILIVISFCVVVVCAVLFFTLKNHKDATIALAMIAMFIGTVFVFRIDYNLETLSWDIRGNGYAALALFALYIVYLLLRRFYAPAKARIQAFRAERQANRKPTKNERIAELERKVAELENKDKQ